MRVTPQTAAEGDRLRLYVAKQEGIDVRTITEVRVLRKSIDARQRNIAVNLKLRVYIGEEPQEPAFIPIDYPCVAGARRVVVVGEGPAGLFAALRLIELGLCPVVVERGKDVRARKRDIASIPRLQKVDPESNYCFGEGGAGAYSDGKLYTRSKKRGNVDRILNIFCQHGAPLSILSDAHPHIGTDKLPRVIESMRNTIIGAGGEVHHQTRMDALLAGVALEAKGIAVGVRLEHPSELIDKIQYHNPNGRGRYLPAAEYSFVTQVEGRGVYSFCMCPGGFVIPAATSDGQVVVNGMSPASRAGRWSNSGMVVETRPEDIEGDGPLKVMRWQERLERLCWTQAGMRQAAPAQRMMDFVSGKLSYDLPRSSYAPGLVSSPLHFWLPDEISVRLRRGFEEFGRKSRGFLTNEAVLMAIETRTSAPVRIRRDAATLMHIGVEGLFPCGEGAGYAGGIVSAAIDGERCAEMCLQYINA